MKKMLTVIEHLIMLKSSIKRQKNSDIMKILRVNLQL